MVKIKQPNKKELKGPWLLAKEDLLILDTVLNIIEGNLIRSWEIQKSNEIDKENGRKEIIERHLSNIEHTKYFIFKDKNRQSLQGESIKDIIISNEIRNFSPIELEIKIEYGYLNCNYFEIKIKDSFTYECFCFDNKLLNEIYYQIETWTEIKKPNKFLFVWKNVLSSSFILGVFIALTYSMLEFKIKDNILGVDINMLDLKAFTVFFVLFVLIGFPPSTLLGVGKNEKIIKIRKFQLKYTRWFLGCYVLFLLEYFFNWLNIF